MLLYFLLDSAQLFPPGGHGEPVAPAGRLWPKPPGFHPSAPPIPPPGPRPLFSGQGELGMPSALRQDCGRRDTHRGRPVAMQKRSMMSLELQYLLKTTCGQGDRREQRGSGCGSLGFLSGPSPQAYLKKRNP